MSFREIPISLCAVLLTSFCVAQNLNEPDLHFDSLLLKLHNVIALQKSIETDEIKGVYKLTAWHFVPSLNYDFINNNYYFTISSGPLVSNLINRRQEKRRLSAIERRYDNQIKSSEIRLRSLIVSINQNFADLYLSYQIVANDLEVYQIKFFEHSNNEIDTETFLKEKSAILNKIRNHNSSVAVIQKQLLEVELLTETEITLDLSEYFINPSKILGL